MTWVRIGHRNDFPEGAGRLVVVQGEWVAVFRTANRWYAIANRCPHAGGPLVCGYRREEVVYCPWHGWGFHLSPGQCVTRTDVTVRVYPIREMDEWVWIAIRAEEPPQGQS